MFGEKSTAKTAVKTTVKPVEPTIDSFLGEDIKIEGKIETERSLRLDGTVIGDVKIVDTLVIGQKGHVNGNIDVGEIEIYGRVTGNVFAKKSISILSTGLVEGDIETPSLNIEDGGRLNGKSTMSKKEKLNFKEMLEEKPKDKKADL